MIRYSTSLAERRRLCNSEALTMLLSVKPLILEEDRLSRPDLHPNSQPDEERESSEAKHQNAIDKFDSYRTELERGNSQDAPIGHLVKLLWMIRSNVQHGAKAPRNLSQEKVSRDREISSRWLGVVDILFDMLLDYPNSRLALLPDDRDQPVIAGITAEWSTNCSVEWTVAQNNGRQVFGLKEHHGESVDVHAMECAELASSWSRLEECYQGCSRILVPVKIDGQYKVSWIYAHPAVRHRLNA